MSRSWILLAIAAAGCSNPENDPEFLQQLRLGNEYYKNGKYDMAKTQYERAIESCPTSYEAIVGLASASREWGLMKYAEVEDLYRAKKYEFASQQVKKANAEHKSAQLLYLKAIQLKPELLTAYRELGVLHYKRATSPYNYPHRVEEKTERHRERDEAILRLKYVVDREPKAYFAQRYLGLAYIAAGKTSLGREHLARYLQGMAEAREYIIKFAPARTTAEKEDKQGRLDELNKDITEVRGVLLAYLEALREDARRTERGSDPADLKKLVELLDFRIAELRAEAARHRAWPHAWVALDTLERALLDVRRVNFWANDPDVRVKLLEGLNREILQVEALITKFREVEEKKPNKP